MFFRCVLSVSITVVPFLNWFQYIQPIFSGPTQTVNAFATGHVEQLKTCVIQMFRF